MIDEFAKDNLHRRLRRDREALLWKLDGLSEYDVRRPLTATGTNLLGLVKHVATVEARYFGEVFDRPSPESLARWQDSDGSDQWATEDETRDQIIGFYRRTWEHEVFSNMTLLTHAIDIEGDSSLQSGQPLTVHTTAVLLAFGADPELADPDGHTPMDMAVHYGHDLAVNLLWAHINERAAGNRRGCRRCS
jgi:hypothetical protein